MCPCSQSLSWPVVRSVGGGGVPMASACHMYTCPVGVSKNKEKKTKHCPHATVCQLRKVWYRYSRSITIFMKHVRRRRLALCLAFCQTLNDTNLPDLQLETSLNLNPFHWQEKEKSEKNQKI